MITETNGAIALQPTGNPFVDTGLYAMLARAEELHPDNPPDALTPALLVFGLSYDRLGVFRNEGDRIEMDEVLVGKYLKEGKIEKDPDREIYRVKDNQQRQRATMILRSLAVLRGGAKQAQFGTDVTPKAIVLAGLNCGNLIFNDLFEEKDQHPVIKLAALRQIIADYQDRLVTPIFIGVREGYLHPENEKQLKDWVQSGAVLDEKGAKADVILSSPIKAVEALTERLKESA